MSQPLVSSDLPLEQQAAPHARAKDHASPRAAAGAVHQDGARRDVEHRVDEIRSKANPLLAAARPLLRALADMPASLRQDEVAALKRILVREAKDFQSLCDRANIRREHVLAAQYCLCTALDEAANGMSWGRHTWATNSLLIQLHGENDGGEKVFLLLGRLLTSQSENIDVIEVIYHILSLGFLGRYAGHADGHRQLDAIRQRLLHLISGTRESVPRDLSPHWRGADAGRLRLLRTVPVWVTVSVLALAVFGLFAWYKYQLLFRTHDLEQQILAIGKATPPEPPRVLRLAELLRDEIARGVVSVQEDATRSAITFRGDDMFGRGRADVSEKILPLLDKVAAEVSKVTGKVTVIGHTDNVPIKTAKYPSNQALSEERAATVAEYLASKGVAKNRLEAIGKGDSQPLADNKAPVGRARNRRVEIVVTQ